MAEPIFLSPDRVGRAPWALDLGWWVQYEPSQPGLETVRSHITHDTSYTEFWAKIGGAMALCDTSRWAGARALRPQRAPLGRSRLDRMTEGWQTC
eukprot:2425406-Prymnesium_polylepis.1